VSAGVITNQLASENSTNRHDAGFILQVSDSGMPNSLDASGKLLSPVPSAPSSKFL
jgi:hypothetical protein